jgi:Thioredoxin like C-terminal domain
VNGNTTAYRVSEAPDIYALVGRNTPEDATLTVTLSPGLNAYSFTFG